MAKRRETLEETQTLDVVQEHGADMPDLEDDADAGAEPSAEPSAETSAEPGFEPGVETSAEPGAGAAPLPERWTQATVGAMPAPGSMSGAAVAAELAAIRAVRAGLEDQRRAAVAAIESDQRDIKDLEASIRDHRGVARRISDNFQWLDERVRLLEMESKR